MRRSARPHEGSRSTAGLTLVEALVALAVLGVQVTAMVAVLGLAARLLRLAAVELAALDAPDVLAVCGAVAGTTGPRASPRSGRRGFTLVEVLVALALTAVVASLMGAVVAVVAGAKGRAEAMIDRHLVAHGMRLAIAGDVARAGEGVSHGECGLSVRDDRRAIDVALVDASGGTQRVTYVADVDGSGRPALYRRVHPHPRQPWLEDVRAFYVERLEAAPGAASPARQLAIHVVLRHDALADPIAWRVALPHQPCLMESLP
jgi:prepilin-type N-terminal cleavage/methylation domain-containing protein